MFNIYTVNKLWKLKNVEQDIPEDLHTNPVIAKLLFQRGICTPQEVEKFFNPKLEDVHNPFLMKDMDKAVERLHRAVENKERICVYGDYDVDGITAVSLVYIFLEKLLSDSDNLGFFIPDRYIDGYGLSKRGIDYAYENNVSLMIVLDCGIKAVEEVLYAKEKGIDVIVCDHHLAEGKIPQAYAVLDPKREDCPYPCKHLSGCGVGLKLVWAYSLAHHLSEREYIYPLLDLAALSIASDIVPVVDENRILSYYGLMLVNTRPRPGFETLFRYANIRAYRPENHKFMPAPPARGTNMSRYYDKEISNSDLVFSLGPRLNAAGRVRDGKVAVRLMICKRMDEAEQIARLINNINTERKNLDHTAYQEALEMIVDKAGETRASTVVFDAAWSQGIVGIVASRLTETFYRPTIVFTTADADKNTLVGSARSVKGFNIYEAISACADMGLIDHFGGHKYAAGLTIRLENYEKFRDTFEKIVLENLNGEEPQQEIEIDDELSFEQITPELVAAVKEFAPFGPKNLNPLFVTKNVLTEKASCIKEKHLKLLLFQQESCTKRFEGIAFKQSDAFERIARNKPFDVCYHLEENSFNGNTSIQLNIQDMHFPE